MRYDKIIFDNKGWKRIKTPCMRCGLTVGNVIILRGNNIYHSLCKDCSFRLNFHFLELKKKPLVKSVLRKIIDDIDSCSWHIMKSEDDIDTLKLLKILGFERHEIDIYYPEVIAEKL